MAARELHLDEREREVVAKERSVRLFLEGCNRDMQLGHGPYRRPDFSRLAGTGGPRTRSWAKDNPLHTPASSALIPALKKVLTYHR